MQLIKATEADSDRLKSFFESVTLPGAIDLAVRRGGSFFDHYRLFSDDFETYMLIDDKDEIAGVGSLVFSEGLVLGEKQTWGYATDLRIRPSRKAVLQWAQHFLPILEQAREQRRCRAVISAIELHHNQATNALIRPTSFRRLLPRYHLLNRFHIVSLHARIPLARRPERAIRLKALTVNELEAFCDYLRDRARLRPLAAVHTPETFVSSLRSWSGLELGDFRIATDVRGNILGSAASWNGSRVQSFVPKAYNGFALTVHQTLSVAGRLGLVRPTARPPHEMAMRMLTHLTCDSPEVFHRLADDAFDRLRPKEFLSYLHFKRHWRTIPPRSFVATALPFGLYMVVPPNAESLTWSEPSMSSWPPEFDIAWL